MAAAVEPPAGRIGVLRFLSRHPVVWLGVTGLLLVRSIYLWAGGHAVDADEAIVGLMARDILRGHHPVWFWGQTYMGSLEAYTAAAFFTVLPAADWVLKLAPLLHTLLLVWVTQKFIQTIRPEVEAGMIWLPAVFSAPFFLSWSLKARGGYMLTLLLGMMLFLLGVRMISQRQHMPRPTCGGMEAEVIRMLGILLLAVLGAQLLFGGFSFRIFGVRIGNSSWWKPLTLLTIFLGALAAIPRYRTPLELWKSPLTRTLAALGLVAGLSWWTNALVIFFWVPLGIVLGVTFFQRLLVPGNVLWLMGVLIPSFFAGSFPKWLYQWREGVPPVGGMAESGLWRQQLTGFFQTGLPQLFGLFVREAPPLSERIRDAAGAGLLLAGFFFFFTVFRRSGSETPDAVPRNAGTALLGLFLLLTPLIFSLSSFGDFVAEPRYLLPLYWGAVLPAAVLIGHVWLRKRAAAVCLMLGWLAVTAAQWSQIRFADQQPMVRARRLPVSFNPLLELLSRHGVEAVWADYWIAYRITFDSREEIIAAPYPPGVNDRQPRFQTYVKQHPAPAYVIPTSIFEGFQRQLAREGRAENFSLELMPPFAVFLPLPAEERPAGER